MLATMETKLPRLQTALPGPKAKKVLALDEQYVSPSYTRDYPLVAKTGRGAVIAGRVLTAIPALFLALDASMKLILHPAVVEGSAQVGSPGVAQSSHLT